MKPQVADSKTNSSGSSVSSTTSTLGEANECLFEFLHAEIMNYVIEKNASESNVKVNINFSLSLI